MPLCLLLMKCGQREFTFQSTPLFVGDEFIRNGVTHNPEPSTRLDKERIGRSRFGRSAVNNRFVSVRRVRIAITPRLLPTRLLRQMLPARPRTRPVRNFTSGSRSAYSKVGRDGAPILSESEE
jgi:hypothetical protein